jgi:fatty acid desaturase
MATLATIPPTAAISSGGFAPPLVVVVVVFCLLFVLLTLAVAYAKRDVSIDFTVLEIRK